MVETKHVVARRWLCKNTLSCRRYLNPNGSLSELLAVDRSVACAIISEASKVQYSVPVVDVVTVRKKKWPSNDVAPYFTFKTDLGRFCTAN